MNGLDYISKRFGITLQVIRTALSAGLAWTLALLVTKNNYPYFAPLAALIVSQVTIAGSLQKAMYRIIGVIGGVIVSILIGHWIHLNAVSIFLVALIGMALSNALNLHPQITSQVGVSSLLVLAFGHEPGYAIGRIVETILGSAVAIGINAVIIPRNEIPAAEKLILELSEQLTITLRNLALLLQKPEHNLRVGLDEARAMVKKAGATSQAVKLAEQSLKYSPFFIKKWERLKHLSRGMSRLERITIEVRGIARGVYDLENALESKNCLANAIEATARCITIFGETIISPTEEIAGSLEFAIAEARVQQYICLSDLKMLTRLTKPIDVGSILTDLNRILREVSLTPEYET